MTRIKLILTGASVRPQVYGRITAGAVGIKVSTTYNDEWDGLSSTLVCKSVPTKPKKDVSLDYQIEVVPMVIDSEGNSSVPPECLIAGYKLYIGVDGWSESGNIRIPTIWGCCGTVEESVDDAELNERRPDPTPSEIEQLTALAQNATAVAESVRADADAGKFNGKSVKTTSTVKVEDYLHEYSVDLLDYDYAYGYFQQKRAALGANCGCSSVRSGNIYGRNFDWFYDESVEFIVKTPANNGMHGTIGVAGRLPALTKEFVESGEWHDDYKILPFMIADGINDAGVVCSIHVVPADKGVTTGTVPAVQKKTEMCSLMLPRFILDKFSSATAAVEYIRDYVSVYMPEKLGDMGYEVHFMVADGNNTYALEFIDNEVKIIDIGSNPYMTNFYLYGVSRNADGTVYTPATQDSEHNAISTNGIIEHGSGLERYNLIVAESGSANTLSGMQNLMDKLLYTNTYNYSTSPFWYTEYVGGQNTVVSNTSDFNSIIDSCIENYQERSRGDGKTWHTVHSSVYDIAARKLRLKVQECEDEHEFGFDYYTAEQVAQMMKSLSDRIEVLENALIN